MEDGATISISTAALTTVGTGFAAWFIAWIGYRKTRKTEERNCSMCEEHARLVSRVNELEKASAAQTAYLKSIDSRLENLNDLLVKLLLSEKD